MLGITGSFGRYVEHYFQQRQLRRFLSRTALAATLFSTAVLFSIVTGRDWFSWIIFGDTTQSHLVLALCATLVTTISFNYLLEVFVAIRRPRVACTMQLISSWTFAASGLLVVGLTDAGSLGVILCFALGNLAASFYALSHFQGVWGGLEQSDEALSHMSLWGKLAPFAIGLWMINIVTNLFDMVDRYMIVHFSGTPATAAQAMVGQYFSSMAVPLLMVGVCGSLAHLVMPYLAQDWEAKRFAEVSRRLNLSIKLVGMMLAVGSVVLVLFAPLLFGYVFAGKYSAGLAILPWTITFCYWKGISAMAYNYLYCVEKTRLTFVSLSLGLVINIVLNALLLPSLGILGAALASAIGTAANLLIVFWFSKRFGLALDSRVFIFIALPLTLCLGPGVAAISLTCVLIMSVRTGLVFTLDERRQIDVILAGLAARMRPVMPKLGRASAR
jgi:O-antigen/teichoic acid export membrane protein